MLRGCGHYVSWNVNVSVVLCSELSEKQNKTKQHNNTTTKPELMYECANVYVTPLKINKWNKAKMVNLLLTIMLAQSILKRKFLSVDKPLQK